MSGFNARRNTRRFRCADRIAALAAELPGKRSIQGAYLGVVCKLPMGIATIVEDLDLVEMAVPLIAIELTRLKTTSARG